MANPKKPANRQPDPTKDPECASTNEDDTLDPSKGKPSMHRLAEEGAAEYRQRLEERKKKESDHES